VNPEEYAIITAEVLGSLIEDAGDDKEVVCLPRSLWTAMLTLLEYVLEDAANLPPPIVSIPPPLRDISILLANEIAARGEVRRR